jgi:glycosyltransferase involved in cell wall biosynthesis
MNQTPIKHRVLFVDHTALLGGGEIALLNVLAELDRSRFEPIVLLFSEGPLVERVIQTKTRLEVLPLATKVVNARKDGLGIGSLMRLPEVISSARFVWKLRRFIKDNQIDLVHTNSLKADVLAGLAARLAGVPLIWHIRDRIDPDYLPRTVVLVFRWFCRILPDVVIANSAGTLATVGLKQSARGVAIPSGIDFRSRIVHDGLNSEVHDKPSGEIIGNGRRIVGLVGRISPSKGQHIFLKAAAQVHRRFPDVRFQIIGAALFNERDYERQVRQLASDLELQDQVEFTGFRDDVPRLISNMEILVHASVTAEPFGQVIAEGMAAGKPVVATAGGGVLEIVLDRVTGLLVGMGDVDEMSAAICRLLEDPEAAKRMGERGRARVLEHFNIKETVAKIEGVYDEVLAARASGNNDPAETSLLPVVRNIQ